jgi:hypothetical protein
MNNLGPSAKVWMPYQESQPYETLDQALVRAEKRRLVLVSFLFGKINAA